MSSEIADVEGFLRHGSRMLVGGANGIPLGGKLGNAEEAHSRLGPRQRVAETRQHGLRRSWGRMTPLTQSSPFPRKP